MSAPVPVYVTHVATPWDADSDDGTNRVAQLYVGANVALEVRFYCKYDSADEEAAEAIATALARILRDSHEPQTIVTRDEFDELTSRVNSLVADAEIAAEYEH